MEWVISHHAKYAVDVLWSSLVVCPLIIIYWSGTWRLLDLTFTSSDALHDAVFCMSAGFIVTLAGYEILPQLEVIVGALDGVRHFTVSRSFLYLYAFGMIAYWRGIWNCADIWAGQNLERLIMLGVFAALVLLILRAGTSAIGSPFAVELDSEVHFYHTFPRFRTSPKSKLLYTADACFTVIVIQTLGILLWFALWSISDILILPVDTYRSYIVSLFGGYAVVMAVFTVQSSVYQLAKAAHMKSPLYALAVEDVYKLVAILATLNLWRGLWGIIKDFVFTNDTGFLLAWFYHMVGFFIMIILGVGRTLASVGCAIDAELGYATGTVWPIMYFRFGRPAYMKTSASTQPHLRISLESENYDNEESAHIV